MSKSPPTTKTPGPTRDQVMPTYAYPPAANNGTVTVKKGDNHRVSVTVNGVFSY